MRNAYNTNDPAKLLELKRKEALSLLEIVRCIRPNMNHHNLTFVVTNTIRAQLGVKKLTLVLSENGQKRIPINFGFERYPTNFDFSFIDTVQTITHIKDSPIPELSFQDIEVIIPIQSGSKVTAWFLIADFADSEAEAQNDIIFIETVGTILTIAIENSLLFEERIQQERIHKELEMAETIQKYLLPKKLNFDDSLDIAADMFSHSRVGGDFYDFVRINEDEILFYIADVSGKGLSSALLVSNLQANIHAQVQLNKSLKNLVTNVNDFVLELTHGEKFITLFIVRLNIKKKHFFYVNAGHNPPVFINRKKLFYLDKGCIPLGIMPLSNIEMGKMSFYSQDLLFMYTDGLSEQENEDGDQMDMSKIDSYLKTTTAPARQVLNEVLQKVNYHKQTVQSLDDTTLVGIRFNC